MENFSRHPCTLPDTLTNNVVEFDTAEPLPLLIAQDQDPYYG